MSPHASYLLQDQVLPRLISAIPNAVPFIAPEDAQEVIQDGVCMAAQMIHNAEKNGKRVVQSPTKANGQYRKQTKEVTAGNIAFYTIQKLRNGRRSIGSSCSDVHASMTQLYGRSKLSCLDSETGSVDDVGEPLVLHDVLANQHQECVSVAVARKLDWQQLYDALLPRQKAIITLMIQGKSGSAMARKLKVTVSAIQTGKRHLAKAIIAMMGEDVLSQVTKLPRWRQDLQAIREKMACREERRHL